MLLVRTLQRYTINPLMRLFLAIGINPLGLAILETRGHISGKTRQVPVGNGRKGDGFWIIAEHGTRAGYVHNSGTTPEYGYGCALDCATAGYPVSPPCAPAMIPSLASATSLPGTRCGH